MSRSPICLCVDACPRLAGDPMQQPDLDERVPESRGAAAPAPHAGSACTNTIAYRLQRSAELLCHPLDERAAEVQVALAFARQLRLTSESGRA